MAKAKQQALCAPRREPIDFRCLRRLGLFAMEAQKPDNRARPCRNPSKKSFLSVNYLTLFDRFLNDAA